MLIPIVVVGLLSFMPVLLESNQEALAPFNQGNHKQLMTTKDLFERAYHAYSNGYYAEIIRMNWEQWVYGLVSLNSAHWNGFGGL